jgi:RNA polymerase sigma factor (sigma-70 family)
VKEKEFLQLIQQHQGIIYKLVLLYAADEEEKKDLYQEIVLQCWKSYDNFKGEAKFGTWLYRLTINTILTLKRKQNFVEYKDSLESLSNTVTVHPDNKNTQSLQWAIRQLAETDRAIISMHLDGYENAEIAAAIGINNNNVAVKLHRIKQQLAKLLNSER